MPSRHEKERSRKKKGSSIASFFTTLLLLIAIGVFSYSAYKLYGYYKDYKAGVDEYASLEDSYTTMDDAGSVEELEDPDAAALAKKVSEAEKEETTENGQTKQLPLMTNPIDFDELRAINEEIIGWIRIGGIDVSYPIAKGADNDFYLHRTFEKQYNFAGCIFLNYSNSSYFTDQNSIVYGHNMKNGSMFGTLKKFKDQELYDKNPYFWIFTPTLIYQYRIFSAREIALSGKLDVYTTRFTEEDFQKFIDTAIAQSQIDAHDPEITAADRIVTLSTCTGNDATRFILQGKLEQIYLSREK